MVCVVAAGRVMAANFWARCILRNGSDDMPRSVCCVPLVIVASDSEGDVDALLQAREAGENNLERANIMVIGGLLWKRCRCRRRRRPSLASVWFALGWLWMMCDGSHSSARWIGRTKGHKRENGDLQNGFLLWLFNSVEPYVKIIRNGQVMVRHDPTGNRNKSRERQ